MDVLFPSRSDSFLFRNELEVKYQTGLNRTATATSVDREGEVVWTQEYIRYRVNGCDHATAVSRVLTQIDGGAAGGICAAPPEGLVIFPSRADSLQFRRELETKYQSMGRGASLTFVDAEGGVIWTQEYLRYRANACDHSTAGQKVFSQIDGGPVPATCFVPCTFALSPGGLNSGAGGSSQSFEVRPNPGGCSWTRSYRSHRCRVARRRRALHRVAGRLAILRFVHADRQLPHRRAGHHRVPHSQHRDAVRVDRDIEPAGRRQLCLHVVGVVLLRHAENYCVDWFFERAVVHGCVRRHRRID
jgi:hypothetical protein